MHSYAHQKEIFYHGMMKNFKNHLKTTSCNMLMSVQD